MDKRGKTNDLARFLVVRSPAETTEAGGGVERAGLGPTGKCHLLKRWCWSRGLKEVSRQPRGWLGAGDSMGRPSEPEPATNLRSPQFQPPFQVWALEGCPGCPPPGSAPNRQERVNLRPPVLPGSGSWLPVPTHPPPSRREGVNLRPPGLPPNQAQAAGSPSCGPRRDPLAPCLPARFSAQPPTGFHLLTGGRFTADHPGPSTRLRCRAAVKSRV